MSRSRSFGPEPNLSECLGSLARVLDRIRPDEETQRGVVASGEAQDQTRNLPRVRRFGPGEPAQELGELRHRVLVR